MKLRVYVNHIFPADCEVSDDGEIGNPVLVENWLNTKWFQWLFDFSFWLLSLAYWRKGFDPVFEARMSRKEAQKLKDKWPEKYAYKNVELHLK